MTVEKQRKIIKELLPAHAVSGCDTVACYFGVGKGSVVKILRAGFDLSAIGEINSPLEKVIEQATAFISACYAVKQRGSMSDTRIHVRGILTRPQQTTIKTIMTKWRVLLFSQCFQLYSKNTISLTKIVILTNSSAADVLYVGKG